MVARPPWPQQRGVVVLVFLVLLVLGSLAFLTGSLGRIGVEAGRSQATRVTLNQARDALLGYAATYRDTHSGDPVFGYLPCPDVDGDGSADALDAYCGGTDDKVVVGLLPYRQLGLSEHRDATGACLWYAVSGTFKASTNKPAPMNWDSQGRLAILDADGNTVVAPEDGQGGAAAAVIAAGPPLAGQNRSGDPCAIADARAVHAAYLDGGYAFPGATGATVQLRQGRTGSADNNDQIAWVTPREIFERVKRRSDFADHLDSLIGELEASLNAGRPAPENAQNKGDKKVGEVPAATSVAATWQNYRNNWRDQFRYALCNDTGASCMTVNGSGCAGALIFAGERAAGGPRTAADKASLASYLDAGNLTAYGADSPPPGAFNGAAAVAIADPSAPAAADVVRCLPPILISFERDIAGFQAAGDAQAVTIDTLAKTVALGDTIVGGAARGCAWYSPAVPFGNGLRIYFRHRIDTELNGFAFAIADAARNAGTGMCGGTSYYLGYASGASPINPPKIGLEFDMYQSPSRNDPAAADGDHVGLVYWGSDGNADDDNVHGVGNNPAAAAPEVQLLPMATATDHHVRFDIRRSYAAGSGSYVLKAYVATGFSGCTLSQFRNLASDLADQCATLSPTVSDSIVFADPADGLGEALRNITVGFTLGQSNDQKITIYDLTVQSRP